MKSVGANFYAVSSTTMCEEDYPKVLDELHELIALDGNKVLPVMWITPEGLKGNIAWFFESDIQWRMLKIHPFLHPNEWTPGKGKIEEVIDIAREMKLPLLIHTGTEGCCQSALFENSIAENCDVTFILAHGRPSNQAIGLVKKYGNAYSDSAFMPVAQMKQFVDSELSHKLLWGTDMCIPEYFFPNENMMQYYLRKINAFQKVSTRKQFIQVTFQNATKLLNL